MQLVVEISEDTFFDLKRKQNRTEVDNAVLKGTPLPKGHGRLIDADSMKTMKTIQSANFNAVELIRLWIDNQQTIIEADTAEDTDY